MSIDIDNATAKELREWRKTIDWSEAPEGALDQLNDLIVERMVREGITGAIADTTATQKAAQQDELAMKRWPELRNKESDFYKRTMELIPESERTKPGRLLAAANEAGFQMYGNPSGRVPPETMAPGRNGDVRDGSGNTDKESYLARTSKLRGILEGEGLLKATPDALERIAATAAHSGEDV